MFCWQILSYGSEFCCIVNMTIQFLFLNFLSQNIERNRRKEKRKSFWLYQHGPLLLNMKYITVKYGGGFYILCSMTLSYKHAAVYWYTTWQIKVGNSSSFSIIWNFLWRKWKYSKITTVNVYNNLLSLRLVFSMFSLVRKRIE